MILKTKKLGKSKREERYRTFILFYSYTTPVAFRRLIPCENIVFTTDVKYSQTTTRHIHNWSYEAGCKLRVLEHKQFLSQIEELKNQ